MSFKEIKERHLRIRKDIAFEFSSFLAVGAFYFTALSANERTIDRTKESQLIVHMQQIKAVDFYEYEVQNRKHQNELTSVRRGNPYIGIPIGVVGGLVTFCGSMWLLSSLTYDSGYREQKAQSSRQNQ